MIILILNEENYFRDPLSRPPGAVQRLGAKTTWYYPHYLMKNKIAEKVFLVFFLVAVTALGFGIRYQLRLTPTWDFNIFLSGWYETVKRVGWKSIAGEFSDYSPPYIYLLYLVHRIFPALSNVEAVKLPAILADFINAVLGMGIVYSITKSRVLSMFCFASLFVAPTIFINRAYWGQADSIFTCGILASLWCIVNKKPALSIFAFGIALAIKLQAIFIAPFLLALALTGFFTWKSVFAFPLSMFLSYLPAWPADPSRICLPYIFHRPTPINT